MELENIGLELPNAKFFQNPEILRHLVDTDDGFLVEGSPCDNSGF